MKKLLMVFVAFAVLLGLVFNFGFKGNKIASAAASEMNYDEVETWFGAEYQKIIFEGESVRLVDRTAGTAGERQMAEYLETRMLEMGYEPIGNDATHPSFEEFEFESGVDGNLHLSQNVMFVRRGTSSAKRVIVCTSYDNAYGFADEENALAIIGRDASTNNVLTVLSIAHLLADKTLDFDVEIVFFGAGYHSFAGSKFFALGIDDNFRASTLVALNIDDLSDETLYFFDKDGGSVFGNYVANFVNNNGKTNLPRYEAGNSVILKSYEGLPYSHRALVSDNISLMNSGIRTVSFLSVSKNGVLGNEYYAKSEIQNFDSKAYPTSYMERASALSFDIASMIVSDGFARSMTGSAVISSFWTNEKLPFIATLVVIGLMIVAYFVVHNNLYAKMKKSYSKQQAQAEIKAKIDKQIDESDNPQLHLHKNDIHNLYQQDLSEKMGDDEIEQRHDKNDFDE